MTTEEIFSNLAAHMIKGMMVHEQLANLYHFLALDGYKCCHEYHFLAETLSYRKLQKFYIEKYNKLIPEVRIETPSVIPENWYKHLRQDVDGSSKRTYVKNALTTWCDWEKDTHKALCEWHKMLEELQEYSAADYIKELIKDVELELLDIDKKWLTLSSVDYSMVFIMNRQKEMKEKYSKKKKELL